MLNLLLRLIPRAWVKRAVHVHELLPDVLQDVNSIVLGCEIARRHEYHIVFFVADEVAERGGTRVEHWLAASLNRTAAEAFKIRFDNYAAIQKLERSIQGER